MKSIKVKQVYTEITIHQGSSRQNYFKIVCLKIKEASGISSSKPTVDRHTAWMFCTVSEAKPIEPAAWPSSASDFALRMHQRSKTMKPLSGFHPLQRLEVAMHVGCKGKPNRHGPQQASLAGPVDLEQIQYISAPWTVMEWVR